MTATEPKKAVTRSVAIALQIICIVLAVSLAATVAYSIFTINHKNDVINELNDTFNLRKYTVWINNETVSQNAGNYTSWKFTSDVSAAGYLQITTKSTTNNTYLEVILNASVPVGYEANNEYYYNPIGVFYHYRYDTRINLPSWKTVNVFPVLPWTSSWGEGIVEIRVGNTNTIDKATETVLVTYYY